ncbi:MAG: hypothetical protein NZ455_10595 [Bacteroidia bacterium]|nr:hypothetical protein [Bacteroidia bacterium]MDW8346564.1 hypothetical protein [Bacteroidia bacterium]
MQWSLLLAQHGNWSPVDYSKIPSPVLAKFKEMFPKAAHTTWGMRYEGKKLMYHVTGNLSEEEHTHFRVKFREDGTVITHIYRVDPNTLNDKIKEAIQKEKANGWELTKAFHRTHKGVETYGLYFKHISDKSKHLHLRFDKEGNEIVRDQDRKEHSKKHHLKHR